MNAQERKERAIANAKARKDPTALAIAEGGRRWTPEPETAPMVLLPWAGIRWSTDRAA